MGEGKRMNARSRRHAMIRELIAMETISTHESMAQALSARQIQVSQSTLSKDLRELGVVRAPCAGGGFRYTLPSETDTTQREWQILERELRDYITGVDRAETMVVIKTMSGHAQAVCEAIDRMNWEEVMGTLAGENTIFAVARNVALARGLEERIRERSAVL